MAEPKDQEIYNQRDIEEIIADDLTMTRKDVKHVIDNMWSIIHEKVEEGALVRFQGVGRFYLSERGEHPARHMKTGEDIIIGRHKTLRFSPSRTYAKRLRLRTEQLSDEAKKQNKKAKST